MNFVTMYDPSIFTANKNEDNTMKYRIATTLLEAYDIGDEISKTQYEHYRIVGVPESWMQPVEQDFKEGDWIYYKPTEYVGRATKEENWEGGAWQCILEVANKEKSRYRKATTDEIEQALIKEAKRRGFEGELDYSYKNGVRYTFDENDGNWQYDAEFDELTHSSSPYCIVYRKGSFAEIVDQTPHIEINGYEAEFYEDYVKFGCAKIDKRFFKQWDDEINTPAEKTGYGNRAVTGIKVGEGLFELEDIQKIAEYYE